MNEVLRSILSSKSVVSDEGITRPLHSNISNEEGNFVQAKIRSSQPRVSLEIGCAYGISSLYICEALREVNATKHVIIDPSQHLPHGKGPFSGWEGIGLANLRRAGYSDLIEFHEVPSYQCLSRLTEGGTRIDFAFVDGVHTFDYALVDVFLIDKLLNPGGIIVLDDLSYPAIRSLCRYILTNLRYRCAGPPSQEPPAWKKLAFRVSSKAPLRTILAPAISVPDWRLHLPKSNFVALQKVEDDLIGEGQRTTRRWDDHVEF
jgi:predicted O-methyltransferase YrrM